MRVLQRLWQDDAGFIVSAELILVATILVIGLMVGLNAVRNSMVNELADVAAAIDSVNQSYVFQGVTGHASASAGSAFQDAADFCDEPGTGGDTANCISQQELLTVAGGEATAPIPVP